MELSLHAQIKTDAVPLALVVHFLNVLAMDTLSLEERIQNTLPENPLLEAAPASATAASRRCWRSRVSESPAER